MTDDLSLRAKKLLATQYRQLLIDGHTVCKLSSALTEILIWCNDLEFEPGKWLTVNKVYRFNRLHIQQINQMLAEDGFASIFDNFSTDNHQSAAQRNPDEKQGKVKPTHHLVLAAVTTGITLDAAQQHFYTTAQINIELNVDKLNLSAFDSLIVIENRDSFNDWHRFNVNIDATKALIIYRGDKQHSTACKTLLKVWSKNIKAKPLIYFGDFDLAGLRIAASAGYSHLLLPKYNWLEDNVIKQHYTLEQQKYISKLKQDCPGGWKSLLELMSQKRAGLRQQKMYNTSLTLYRNDS